MRNPDHRVAVAAAFSFLILLVGEGGVASATPPAEITGESDEERADRLATPLDEEREDRLATPVIQPAMPVAALSAPLGKDETRAPPKPRPATKSASKIASGIGPSAEQIAQVIAATNVRHFGGALTATPGEQAMPSPYGGVQHYIRRDVSNVSCVKVGKAGAGSYQCGYDSARSTVGASDSVIGQFLQAGLSFVGQQTVRSHWTYVFTKKGNSWTSSELDREVYANAQRVAVQAQQARNAPSSTYESSPPPGNGGIPDFSGTMCDLGSTSYCR